MTLLNCTIANNINTISLYNDVMETQLILFVKELDTQVKWTI